MKTKSLIPLAVLLLITAGCGKKTSYQTSKGGVTIEQKGDTVTMDYKDKAGGMKVVANDKGVALPATFPKDIPLFKDSLVDVANTMADTMTMHTTFKAPWQEAMQFYADKLKAEGWKVDSVMNLGDNGLVVAKKDTRQCSVMLTKDGDHSVAQIMLTGLPIK
ncbi:MAG: hypothetical protein WCR49_14360 [Opitutae bacterium]